MIGAFAQFTLPQPPISLDFSLSQIKPQLIHKEIYMDFLYKNKKNIATGLIAFILFARCNLGVTLGTSVVLVNLLADGLAFLFCGLLLLKDGATTKKGLINAGTLWVILFTALVFVYGTFNIGTCNTDIFSRQLILLTVVPPVLIMIMLTHNSQDIIDILSRAGAVVIVTTLITSLIYDDVWKEWVTGVISESRTGATPAGTCVDTGNLMLIMLIPIIYQIFINRAYKAYIWAAVLGIFEIFASASKSSMFPLVLVFAIMIIGAAKDKKVLRRNIIILIIVAIAGLIALMTVPALYRIIGNRIVELFTSFGAKEYDLHTSTGQRQAISAAVKEHFWENPIFGHGFYAFKEMPYSQLEEYKVNGQVMYRHIQTHNNFYELLFSFGIVGAIIYYWFPVKLIVNTVKTKDKAALLLVSSFLISFLAMDMGIDMFYKYMTPYFTYLVCYCLLRRSQTGGAAPLKEEK